MALGPQTSPDLSLAVPRLGPGAMSLKSQHSPAVARSAPKLTWRDEPPEPRPSGETRREASDASDSLLDYAYHWPSEQEPLGPVIRSLEFQVNALFELMEAHSLEAESSVLEVIERKREAVHETFQCLKEAVWWSRTTTRERFPCPTSKHWNLIPCTERACGQWTVGAAMALNPPLWEDTEGDALGDASGDAEEAPSPPGLPGPPHLSSSDGLGLSMTRRLPHPLLFGLDLRLNGPAPTWRLRPVVKRATAKKKDGVLDAASMLVCRAVGLQMNGRKAPRSGLRLVTHLVHLARSFGLRYPQGFEGSVEAALRTQRCWVITVCAAIVSLACAQEVKCTVGPKAEAWKPVFVAVRRAVETALLRALHALPCYGRSQVTREELPLFAGTLLEFYPQLLGQAPTSPEGSDLDPTEAGDT
eukprot:g28521.t2